MNNSLPDPLPLPPDISPAPFWSSRRRRLAFLIILASGLTLFLAWMPAKARTSLWAALITQVELIVLLSLFGLVTLSMIWAAGQRMDTRIFVLFNTRGYPKWLDRVMWAATQLGTMLFAFMTAFVLYFLNFQMLATGVVLGTTTLWLLVETLKAFILRERPFHTFENTRVIGWREKGDSFPSGHTSQIFFLATLFSQHFQLGPGGIFILYMAAVFVGFTRIYVGAHYPRDVFGGAVLGSIWGLLANLVALAWLAGQS
jgi:membrane-associated phospholipid phosphatase